MKILSTLLLLSSIGLSACTTTSQSVYEQLGGAPKVDQIVENFVVEIENDPVILAYFEGANIDRFVEKLSEQICHRTGGPCEYTGDSMAQVHAGMNINQRDFNRTVDLLINAMNKADVPHPLQNQVLKVLAPTRDEMLYL
ncbi:group I truncated hemoglobin [Alteromonas oceanisediminis]|uniref:group I truncated hemoglobin n=1 Tax=Alteromonas oceanisediminis TaxID=2836180 RepID=UPI001BDB2343|nr:group 1 truncated hemoglobin [Alteromonas oceanisediminis]MBT0586604.1 group 1 truncated hemoglobin [Alteromonas oceanisediminis]